MNSESNLKNYLDAHYGSSLTNEEKEIFFYALLIKNGLSKSLVQILNDASDRRSCNERIVAAVQLVKGPDFGFSQHGIIRRIDRRFDEAQKIKIASMLRNLSDLLLKEVGVESFVTSGTLLGLVREGKFLAHDFDFDMAYISKYEDKDEIKAERLDVLSAINSSNLFRIEGDFPGKAKVKFSVGDDTVVLDLFVAFRRGVFFNEVPLKANTILFEDISPVRTMSLYGCDVFVPKCPEKLLEINYGSSWRTPDPSFRFHFGENAKHYWFLLSNPISPT